MSARATGGVPAIDQGVFLVHLIRARKKLAAGKLDEAREDLEAARLARPDDEDVLNLLSIVEFKRGDFHAATASARALLARNPDSGVLHANLGLILFKAGMFDDAEGELRRALDLKPDHGRSHLTLGLVYRSQGRLDLALGHLSRAGARKLAADVGEALRLAQKAPQPETSADETSAPEAMPATEPETPASSAPEIASAAGGAPADDSSRHRLEEVSDEGSDGQFGEPLDSGLEPPFEAPQPSEAEGDEVPWDRLPTAPPAPAAVGGGADPAAPSATTPLFVVRSDGALEIASRGAVYVRKGSVAWYSGKVRFSGEPAFRGTRLDTILRADGTGYLFVNDPGRFAYRRDLSGEALFIEGSRLLALDHGLSFRLEPIHDFRMNRRVDVLMIHGRGSVILSVAGPLLEHDISSAFPLSVSSRDLVAWSGDLVPSVLEDRFLEEVMQPDSASAPKVRFEGEGTVLTQPPRPRRRASDAAPSGADRRRR